MTQLYKQREERIEPDYDSPEAEEPRESRPPVSTFVTQTPIRIETEMGKIAL